MLVVGGAEFVPGALRLTGEAALRTGAGKLQMATVQAVAMALGVLIPEAAMIALPSDEKGEIAAEAADVLRERFLRCDALILGPGMSIGALTSARYLEKLIAAHDGHVILTPHHGEMAHLSGLEVEAVKADLEGVARDVARRFNAVILLKGQESLLAEPSGEIFVHRGGTVGLATGGSGDVLAGIIGGLAAQGASPLTAAGWGSWLHGRAGELLSRQVAMAGFLARELSPLIPRLIDDATLNTTKRR